MINRNLRLWWISSCCIFLALWNVSVTQVCGTDADKNGRARYQLILKSENDTKTTNFFWFCTQLSPCFQLRKVKTCNFRLKDFWKIKCFEYSYGENWRVERVWFPSVKPRWKAVVVQNLPSFKPGKHLNVCFYLCLPPYLKFRRCGRPKDQGWIRLPYKTLVN